MRWRGGFSVASRLRLLLLAAILLVAVLAAGIAGVSNIYALRQSLARQLVTLSTVIAQNAAGPLQTHDRDGALGILQTLRADGDVRSAKLLDAAGTKIAGYAREGAAATPEAAVAAHPEVIRFTSLAHAQVIVPIMQGGTLAGTLHLDSDFSEVWAQVRRAAWYLLFAVLGALALWLPCQLVLHRLLQQRAAKLAGLARFALENEDFSRRAHRSSNDEIGALADGINGLFVEIERRDRTMTMYQGEFEKRVAERTMQLDQAAETAREAAKRAAEASRAKSEFLARMSHEIRTPMNGVLGMAELLCQSATLDERQRRYALTIHQSGSALLEIINDILDFSKIESGKLQLEMAQFCVYDVIEDAVEIIGERASAKGLEVICDVPARTETKVYGDGLRLRQIVVNLLSNAVKFTERGEIRIKVRQLGSSLCDSPYHFEVTDTGIGIKPENCHRIFESFSQEDISTTRVYGGTGLGLSICKQLVELMGGRIGVVSTPGKGSTFFFSLPLAAEPGALQDRRVMTLNSTRMLLVEGNASNRQILHQHLSGWGIKVVEANTIDQALTILDKSLAGEFDVIIADAQMPLMQGAAFAAAVRQRTELADVPLVLMHSAAAGAAAGEPGAAEGVEWIAKPIRREHLKECLSELVSRRIFSNEDLAHARKLERQPRRRAAGRKSRVRRVLMVEDNPVNQEVGRAMLQELGVAVAAAWSGDEALRMLAAERFDVVLMDCEMPTMDGYEATRQFRAWERKNKRARTPIIAVTAKALDGDAQKCIEAGMDRYLSKPFTMDELFRALEDYAADAPPPIVPTRSEGVLDARTLAGIRAMRKPGAPDLLAKVAGIYASNSHQLINELKSSLLGNDRTSLLRAAHTLKSSSANVGATGLSEICREIEALPSDGSLDPAAILIERLIAEHKEVLQALAQQGLAA